jgi:hypothetical protein
MQQSLLYLIKLCNILDSYQFQTQNTVPYGKHHQFKQQFYYSIVHLNAHMTIFYFKICKIEILEP